MEESNEQDVRQSEEMETNLGVGEMETAEAIETETFGESKQVPTEELVEADVPNKLPPPQEPASINEVPPTNNEHQHQADESQSSKTSIISDTNEIPTQIDTQGDLENDKDQSSHDPKTIKPKKSRKRKVDIVDPSEYVMELGSKRVPGKFIDRFWEPLPPQTMDSLDRILNIALTRAIERYGTLSKSQKLTKKMVEAQKVLARTWINNSESKSFKSRIDVTPLPPTSSMSSKSNQLGDILSFDALLRRKTFLETYLLAELKQLKELDKHHNDLERSYRLDAKYLADFRKTVDIHKQKVSREMATHGEPNEKPLADIHLLETQQEPLKNSSLFDPDVDKDTVEILQLLKRHLGTVAGNTEQLLTVNTKLETIYSLLDMI